jgi:hypothetical protein
MNFRLVALGLLIAVIGVLFILYPSYLFTPSHYSQATKLVRVAPGNYSSIPEPLLSQQTLNVEIQSSPQPVDFFLMNSSSYSAWSKGSPPTDVYPQYSKFNVSDYSFSVSTGSTAQSYTLVFLSRSLSTPNNLIVRISVDSQSSFLQTNAIPLLILVCGVAIVLVGATRGKKEVEAPPPEEEPKGGGLMGLFGGSQDSASPETGRCRYCGASVPEGAAFCPSCNRSQP